METFLIILYVVMKRSRSWKKKLLEPGSIKTVKSRKKKEMGRRKSMGEESKDERRMEGRQEVTNFTDL